MRTLCLPLFLSALLFQSNASQLNPAAARHAIEARIAAVKTGIENPHALASFFASLDEGDPVHILQLGDLHTVSDDWGQTMRAAAQARYGAGGPGFVYPGRPYPGYRRADAVGSATAGWTSTIRGDASQGLGGLAIATEAAGQSVTLKAAGDSLVIFYLQRPGGGRLDLTIDGQSAGTLSTDGDPGPGHAEYQLSPGTHELSLRTLDAAPVRLFGWALDNRQGLTWETLGIPSGRASSLLEWNERIWASEFNERNPGLLILAYGTNEAGSSGFDPARYKAGLTAVIARVRRANPATAILLVGPPDTGSPPALPHLTEVAEAQRAIARSLNVAFWDWRLNMGGPGSITQWIEAGWALPDSIHFSAEGYRRVGRMLFQQLMAAAPGSDSAKLARDLWAINLSRLEENCILKYNYLGISAIAFHPNRGRVLGLESVG